MLEPGAQMHMRNSLLSRNITYESSTVKTHDPVPSPSSPSLFAITDSLQTPWQETQKGLGLRAAQKSPVCCTQ